MSIVVVDYGAGNLGSIRNMLKKVGSEAVVTSDPAVVATADKLILPGVGAFDAGVHKLRERGLFDVVNRKVLEDRTPILGLCLGVQLFTRGSEEGELEGFGWFDARAVRFAFDPADRTLKVPHMGWNYLRVRKPNALLGPADEPQRYYFVHSYHVVCEREEDVAATTEYGGEFVSAISRDNIFGVQFHPEKSHRYGMTLFRRFLEWRPC